VFALVYAGHFSCDLQAVKTEQKTIDKAVTISNFFISKILYLNILNKYMVNWPTIKPIVLKSIIIN